MKRFLLISIGFLFLFGCSTLYDKGKFENRFLRVEKEPNHASIERVDGVGTALETVGESGFPKFWIGKFAHTQFVLPKMYCTTYFREDGETKEREICESIPSLSVEAQVSAQGGRVGDIIQTGDATTLDSKYNAWLEMIKTQVANSTLPQSVKDDYLTTLQAVQDSIKKEETK